MHKRFMDRETKRLTEGGKVDIVVRCSFFNTYSYVTKVDTALQMRWKVCTQARALDSLYSDHVCVSARKTRDTIETGSESDC